MTTTGNNNDKNNIYNTTTTKNNEEKDKQYGVINHIKNCLINKPTKKIYRLILLGLLIFSVSKTSENMSLFESKLQQIICNNTFLD